MRNIKIRATNILIKLFFAKLKSILEAFLIKFMLKYWNKITISQYQKLVEVDLDEKLPKGKRVAKQIEIAFNKKDVYSDWELNKVKFYVDAMYFLLTSPDKIARKKNNIDFDKLKYEDYMVCEQYIVNKNFEGILSVLTKNDNIGRESITKHINTLIDYLKWSQEVKLRYGVIYPQPDEEENKKPNKNVLGQYYQLVYNIGDEKITDIDYILNSTTKSFYNYATIKIVRNRKQKAHLKSKGIIK